MRLKSLELVGFKTFADATELTFDQGITAIIGPNGSGKSNCADALLWVLAERRLSAIRATQSGDVIFAGSANRKPLGFAEVTLTLDNSDHALAAEFNEISVTRRLHRNGDNEYLINHRRCRRKDVVDLFLDTGIGRDSFTVISQREIDAILSIDPQDRRRLLEEVAGIERYRSRREETVQRLESVAQNLTRLGDVTLGLEMQLGPLAEQREVAQRYLTLRERASRLRLSLLVKDWELVRRRRLKSDEDIAALNHAVTSARTLLSQAEAASQRLRLDVHRLDEELAAARGAAGEAEREIDQRLAKRQVAEERLRHLTARVGDASGSLARHEEQRRRAADEAGARQAELVAVTAELSAVAAELQRLEATLREKLERERAAETDADRRRRELAEVTANLRSGEAERQAALRAGAAAGERRQRLAERSGATDQARCAARDELTGLEERVTLAQQQLAAGLAESRRVAESTGELDRGLGRVTDRLTETQADLAEKQARQRVLQEAEARHEGYHRGVRAVLEARDRGRLRADYRSVADLLSVTAGCETAIEAALGSRLQDLVCDTAEEAQAAVEYLKQERAGRATFLPLDLLGEPPRPRGAESPEGLPGVVGHGLELVGMAPELEAVRRHLLARVVVVERLEAGIALRRRGWDDCTIATLDGDLIRPSGAVSGGSVEQREVGLLARRRELDHLAARVAQVTDDLAALRAELAELQAERARLREAATGGERALETLRQELANAERARLEAQAALSRAEAEALRTGESLAELMTEEAEAASRLAAAEAALVAAGQRRQELEAALAGAEESLARARSQRSGETEALSDGRERRGRLDGRRHNLVETDRMQAQAAESAAAEQRRLRDSLAIWEREIAEANREIRDLDVAIAERRGAQAEQGQALEALAAMRRDAARQLEEAVAGERAARQDLSDSEQSLHRAELRSIQVDAELEHLRQTLAEDHRGVDLEQAARQADEIPNRQQAVEELGALRAEMDEMGEVNTGAIEEYERITERLRFYDRQRQDLEEAREDLLQVIAEIDGVTEGRLVNAFDRVNLEFGKLFGRVFGDEGAAALSWTTPDTPLESGIEVSVRLPGKRTQSIMLLSGGERAMTTVTLLLAMFRVKPSPFCLLDELDAPLDEANIRNYRGLLREFSANSQFIVITHNPETTRVADTLYGITMPEPGVSRAYSHRLPAEEETRPADAIRAAD